MQGEVAFQMPAAVSTGAAGLDRILGGGLPGPRVYLVQGDPGTGKTTLGLQFLLEGARAGEPVVYVTMSQSRAELAQIAASHGWSLDGVIVEEIGRSERLIGNAEQSIFESSELDLDANDKAIEKLIEEHAPTRIVFDSMAEMRQLSGSVFRFRHEVLDLKDLLRRKSITTLLLDGGIDFGGDRELEMLAHGIICLEKALPEYGMARRRVEVRKMRGVAFFDGYHDMSIRRGSGVEVYPRIVPNLAPEAVRRTDLIKSDVSELDDMLGGGLEGGTTAIIVGQAGTGKSTLASIYAHAALQRGEPVGVFLFEERLETFFRRCEGLGLNLREHESSGRLFIRDFNPTEVSPGEFSQIVQHIVEENRVRVVVIDSFTGYLNALPKGDEAVMQIQLLVKYLSRRGVIAILIVAQHGLLGQGASTDVDVSFLGDCAILLRMYEWPGLVRRTVAVVKKRHGSHDMAVRELLIGPGGVHIHPFNPPPLGASGPIASGS